MICIFPHLFVDSLFASAVHKGSQAISLKRTLPAQGLALVALSGLLCPAQSVADTSSSTSIIDERSIESRILGGGDAEPGEWPSQVALVQAGEQALPFRLFCGGTVVSSRWVLTAAHCLHDHSNQIVDPSSLRVVGGITNLSADAVSEELEIAAIVIHPDYDPTRELPPHDIALLELQSPIDSPAVNLFVGETAEHNETLGYIVGWGATSYQNSVPSSYPSRLQDAAVPLVSNAQCNSPQSYDGLIMPSHFCAGYVDGEVDACAGDSGGPLYLIQDGEAYQAGITSFGTGCGLPFFYGIYTDISHYIPWLSNYIEVPYQSPELVASRQNTGFSPVQIAAGDSFARGSGASADDSSGMFSGSMERLSICFVLMLIFFRANDIGRRKLPSLRKASRD